MKKLLSVGLCGILSLSLLTACGSSATGNSANAPAAKSGAYLGDFDVSGYVTLGEYTGIEVEVSSEVTDAEVDEYMQMALESSMQKSDSDKAVEDGDTFSADYSGRMADTDEVFEGGTAEDVQITIGQGGYIEGFEEGFLGMVPGEVKEVPLTFPEDYAEHLAGKDVIFTFTMNHHLVPAEAWTDEIAADLGLEGVSTVEELKAYTRDMLKSNKETQMQTDFETKVLETVEANCTFSDPPAEMIERFKEQLQLNAEMTAEQYSEMYGQEITADQILDSQLSQYGFTGTREENIAAYADRVSKVMMMYYAVVQAEGLTIDESQVQSQLASVPEANGYDSVEAMNEELHTDIEKEIRESLYMSAAQEFLLHNNYGVDENGNRVEVHTHEEEAPALEGGVIEGDAVTGDGAIGEDGAIGADGSIGGE